VVRRRSAAGAAPTAAGRRQAPAPAARRRAGAAAAGAGRRRRRARAPSAGASRCAPGWRRCPPARRSGPRAAQTRTGPTAPSADRRRAPLGGRGAALHVPTDAPAVRAPQPTMLGCRTRCSHMKLIPCSMLKHIAQADQTQGVRDRGAAARPAERVAAGRAGRHGHLLRLQRLARRVLAQRAQQQLRPARAPPVRAACTNACTPRP